MDAVAMVLIVVGGLIAFVSGTWYLIVGFRKSVWWGLGMGLPFGGLVFLCANFKLAWKPFLATTLGGIIGAVGFACYVGQHPELFQQDPIGAAMQTGRLPGDTNGKLNP
jgi:hypothetical protein